MPYPYIERHFHVTDQRLSLAKMELETVDVGNILSTLMKHEKEVHVLDLTDNLLCSEGIKRLCQTLDFSNIYLKELYLSGNSIGPSAVDAIGRYLANNENLVVLGLSRCNLGNKGVRTLANFIGSAQSLQVLDVTGNGARDPAIADLMLTSGECNHPVDIRYADGNECSDLLEQVDERVRLARRLRIERLTKGYVAPAEVDEKTKLA
jgi:hypothetical protein